MKTANITRGGQVSIPAEIRHRWATTRVILVDHGTSLELRPLPADPIGAVMGSLRGTGPTTDEIRTERRAEELESMVRKGWS